jgi:hypothetical protein
MLRSQTLPLTEANQPVGRDDGDERRSVGRA